MTIYIYDDEKSFANVCIVYSLPCSIAPTMETATLHIVGVNQFMRPGKGLVAVDAVWEADKAILTSEGGRWVRAGMGMLFH